MSVRWRIGKEFHFSASHSLHGLPDDHQCSRLHGHNYVVVIEVSAAAVDPTTGFVLDYGDLAPFGRYIDDVLDHRHLNSVIEGQTSAELLAQHLHGVALRMLALPEDVNVAIEVRETPKTYARYEP